MAAFQSTTALSPFELTGVEVTDRKLGRGSFATVLELEYMGLKCAGKKIHEVLLKSNDAPYTIRRFKEECRLLSRVRHPNIVQFLGVYFQKGEQVPILVMEFLPTNLTSYIKKYGVPSKETSYSILHDVALGLRYLHGQTPRIIHRDLSSNNVLLTPNMTAKISDLGVARIFDLTPLQVSRMTQTPGTPAYMPPEVMIANPKYNTSVDIFSYGILMIHLFSGSWPAPQVEPIRIELDGRMTPVSEAERRKVFLQAIGNDHPLMDLILRSISNDPRWRPHASEILEQLEDMKLLFLSLPTNPLEQTAEVNSPFQDPTLTVDNVNHIMEKVEPQMKLQVWVDACTADMEREKMEEMYMSGKEYECADLYVNYNLDSSWVDLAGSLYRHHQVAAVEEVRSYLPPRDLTITTEKLMELFEQLDPEKVDELGGKDYLDLPQSEIARIQKDYQSPTQRKEAYLDLYVHQHPCPAWSRVARTLYRVSLRQQANLVDNTYVKVSEKTQQCFDAAMMEGEVSLRNGSLLILGYGGSGKTHVLAAFLKEDPPSIRESTPCAKKPVRAIAHCKARVSDNYFVRITDDHYSDMLVATVPQPNESIAVAKPSTQTEAKDDLNSLASSSTPSQKEDMRQSSAVKVDASGREETWCAHHAMKRQYLRRMQAGTKKKTGLNNEEMLDIEETGGQPMFHEVLPVFIQNTMFGILTVKLNKPLDSYPLVEYYSRGERIGEPFNSPFTHLDTLHHCMRVIRSTCDRNTCPTIAFVGTHKDLEHECPQESREMKEKKLRSIIPKEMEDNIIVQGESLLLAVNVKTPGEEDKEVISILREKAMVELRKLKPRKIPLRYTPLEMAFQRMAKEQRKSVMSKEECFEVAAIYNFTRESFEAALKYLHGLKLIFYYEEILPNIVLIDAQAILDKITELVVHSLSYQAKSTSGLPGALKKFVKCGIVTAEILEEFSSHYVPGLFMKEELILLLKHLRIMAEVGKGEYLMPCLLRKQGIPRLSADASSLVIPALLFYFGRDGPKLGVYCFLLVSLITEAKWELLEEDGYPVQVSRDRVQFALPGNNPGCVTISDPFSSFFHVVIEPPEDASVDEICRICEEVCPTIRETVLTGIRKASQKLNYNNSIPEVAFPCSKHDDLHPAIISTTGFLTCTANPRIYCEMTEQHKFWLGHRVPSSERTSQQTGVGAPVSDSGPVQPRSEDIKIQHLALIRWKDEQGCTQRFFLKDKISHKWRDIGELTGLAFPELDNISEKYCGDPKECCRAVLGQWLDNPPPDYPTTWQGLLELLEDSQLGQVVTELRNVLDKAKLW